MKRSSAVLTLVISLTLARTAAADAPRPKCNSGEYHQFDFWLGDWDAFETEDSSKPIARTHVDYMSDGCALREVYEQNDGLVGEAFNIYDASRKQWHHSWVSNKGQLLLLDGPLKDGKISMDGYSRQADGVVKKIHNVWSVEKDGGIREAAQFSIDDGKTWKPFFDVVFRKHPR